MHTIAPTFDYAALDKTDRVVVEQKTAEIRDRMGRAAQNIVEIGERLIEVQKRVGPRKFAPWLRAEFDWSESAALKMMQVARQFIGINFTGMSVAPSALYLLAAPSTPEPIRQQFIESAQNGKPVTHAEVRAAVAPPVLPAPPAPRAATPTTAQAPELAQVAPRNGSPAATPRAAREPEPTFADEGEELPPVPTGPTPAQIVKNDPTVILNRLLLDLSTGVNSFLINGTVPRLKQSATGDQRRRLCGRITTLIDELTKLRVSLE